MIEVKVICKEENDQVKCCEHFLPGSDCFAWLSLNHSLRRSWNYFSLLQAEKVTPIIFDRCSSVSYLPLYVYLKVLIYLISNTSLITIKHYDSIKNTASSAV